jgi:hypothetical protein
MRGLAFLPMVTLTILNYLERRAKIGYASNRGPRQAETIGQLTHATGHPGYSPKEDP